MSSPVSAVDQALSLLAKRAEELSMEIAALQDEDRAVQAALGELRALTRRSQDGSQPDFVLARGPELVVGEVKLRPVRRGSTTAASETEAPPTVRSAVKALLDENPRAFTPTEIRQSIDPFVLRDKDEKQALANIRTSLWTLRKTGAATFYKGSRDQTISTKWYQSPEGPSAATEEPSVRSDSTPEGGEEPHDDHQPERAALQGHGLL